MANSSVSGKMTQREAINYVLDNCNVPYEVREKFESMIDALNNKSSNSVRKPTARQKENEAIKAAILSEMSYNASYTIGEMLKQFTCLDDTFTSQRVSALMSQLKDEGKVTRLESKGKTYFTLV